MDQRVRKSEFFPLWIKSPLIAGWCQWWHLYPHLENKRLGLKGLKGLFLQVRCSMFPSFIQFVTGKVVLLKHTLETWNRLIDWLIGGKKTTLKACWLLHWFSMPEWGSSTLTLFLPKKYLRTAASPLSHWIIRVLIPQRSPVWWYMHKRIYQSTTGRILKWL